MKIINLAPFFFALTLVSCTKSINQNSGLPATYNIIQPQNGIYVILKKGVSKKELLDNFYEK
jgi:hypothetical protein